MFIHSVMSHSVQSHGLQQVRLLCPSPSSRACSNLCPLNRWYHPTISFSVVPFSSCLLSFSASGPFPMSQLFTSGGQSIAASSSTPVLPMNIQEWFPLGLTGLLVQGTLVEFSPTPEFESINSEFTGSNYISYTLWGLIRWLRGKESTWNAGDTYSISGSGRSTGEENGNSLQYSFLGNFMDIGAWRASSWGHKRIRHDLVTNQ